MRELDVSRIHNAVAIASMAVLMLFSPMNLRAQEPAVRSWQSIVEADAPAIRWSFDGKSPITAENSGDALKSVSAGKVLTAKSGPGRATFQRSELGD